MLQITRYKLFQKAVAMAAAFSLVACHTPIENESGKANAWQQEREAKYRSEIFPAAKGSVKSGDMVTRLGSDITSEMLRHFNEKDASFSHCGIASVEHDTVYVYHAIGGEFNPDQKLKKETLLAFGYPTDNKAVGIFRSRMNDEQVNALVVSLQEAYKAGLPFDMDFNYETDDRQYCAEFVGKHYCAAAKDSSWLQFSSRGSLTYLAVDNLFLSSFMREITRFYY